ncbi:unnamed protein product [Moneuplotes crassus]|uniref:Uncharacterized protein n=1 Tax=Euplotes crassus TaxID=5936 RepID=A0AAD1XDW2_EUPCR|nr:unnamed protein product [Moneuplotes crassus]
MAALNNSPAKAKFSFGTSSRFPSVKKSYCDTACYESKPALSKRSPSFGVGDRFKSPLKDRKPAPGSYKPYLSDFETNKGSTFGISYANYEKVYIKSNKIPTDRSLPGPGAYKIDKTKKGGISIGAKFKSNHDIIASSTHRNPGPGSYSGLNTLSTNGKVVVSTIKSPSKTKIGGKSQRFHSKSKFHQIPGPGDYISNKTLDSTTRRSLSKFQNPKMISFGSSSRVFDSGSIRDVAGPGPGAYEFASEFNDKLSSTMTSLIPKKKKKNRRYTRSMEKL